MSDYGIKPIAVVSPVRPDTMPYRQIKRSGRKSSKTFKEILDKKRSGK